MAVCSIKNLCFSYPNSDKNALNDISVAVNDGEFITLCGKSGCGKSTLLRMLKPSIAPHGKMSGEVLYDGREANKLSAEEEASQIGFVMQNPDTQIVTDKVWHELAFGPESLGIDNTKIRMRVAETASFFGIENWFYKKTSELSGGQKQLLNLASVMVMHPRLLILDEPTSRLDPIAAGEFMQMLRKINAELGTAVILSEHRAEDAFLVSDRVWIMENGRIIADEPPRRIAGILKNGDLYDILPAAARVFGDLGGDGESPISVREGKMFLSRYNAEHPLDNGKIPRDVQCAADDTAIELKNIYFRYDKSLPDVVKNLNVSVKHGEIYALLGGNGTGKTTALSLMAGLNAPQRGEIRIEGRKIREYHDLYNGLIGVLPQEPQIMFLRNSVFADLYDMTDENMTADMREQAVWDAAALCRLQELTNRHPYDLSGGELQRAALAMLLLKKPRILLLDEPTKGMDVHFKKIFGEILTDLKAGGTAIFMVTHDISFCAEYADRCALFFDGTITAEDMPRRFFRGNDFYTTEANRMARTILPDAVLTEDIALAAGIEKKTVKRDFVHYEPKKEETVPQTQKKRKRKTAGGVFALCFAVLSILQKKNADTLGMYVYLCNALCIIFAAFAVMCILPKTELYQYKTETVCKKINKKSKFGMALTFMAIIVTVMCGIHFFGDRKYYFISLLIIAEISVPFFMSFEKRLPSAREIVLISTLCAIAVAGRSAFFMLPEFKPVAAVVIISGVCFGGETGFLVGAVGTFVSNFFFGQGPWTPWQMFAFGTIGLTGGILFNKGVLPKTRECITVFGFLATLLIYGGIMNPASVFMMTSEPTWEMIKASYVMGLPIDLVHALSSAFFLWFLSVPMSEKLERIKVKYGIMNGADAI